MTPSPSEVIVIAENHCFHSVHGSSVRHRDFPEARGVGNSPEDAAERLAEHLSGNLDNVPSDWHREILNRAIDDVRAFAKREHAASGSGPATSFGFKSARQ